MRTLSAALAALVIASLPAPAQTSQKLSAGKATDYGLVYSLPTTALDIYLEAELDEQTPGEFYNYARKHLGINDAITEKSVGAKLKSVTIVSRGVPNPDKRWLAQFKNGTSAYMTLSADNIPLAINSDKTAATETPEIPQARDAEPSPLETPAARQAITADIARSASVSKRAELTAQQIFALRETRSDLLSGQADNAPADGAALKLVLDNLAAQEAALTAMFAGVSANRTVVEKVTFVPDSNEARGKVIARLSAVDGILEPSNLAGAPITIDVKILEQGQLPVTEKGEVKDFPKGGVAYCIPGRAEVSVSYGGKRVASTEVSLAQLGVVFGLNPALFTDKKAPYFLVFDPATGAALALEPVAAE